MREYKQGKQETESNEETYDPGIGPRIRRPSPLKGEKETDNGRDNDGAANKIELFYASKDANVVGVVDARDA